MICKFNNVQIVEKLLEIEDIDIDLQDNDGRTAVFHAALPTVSPQFAHY
jgi:ankyrin repeat protein